MLNWLSGSSKLRVCNLLPLLTTHIPHSFCICMQHKHSITPQRSFFIFKYRLHQHYFYWEITTLYLKMCNLNSTAYMTEPNTKWLSLTFINTTVSNSSLRNSLGTLHNPLVKKTIHIIQEILPLVPYQFVETQAIKIQKTLGLFVTNLKW